jgi:hypothetical protein
MRVAACASVLRVSARLFQGADQSMALIEQTSLDSFRLFEVCRAATAAVQPLIIYFVYYYEVKPSAVHVYAFLYTYGYIHVPRPVDRHKIQASTHDYASISMVIIFSVHITILCPWI